MEGFCDLKNKRNKNFIEKNSFKNYSDSTGTLLDF